MEYKEIIESIIHSKDEGIINSKLLETYILFLVSNPNFKYNQTYFTDSIPEFEQVLVVLNQRKVLYDQLVKELLQIQRGNLNVKTTTIIFDQVLQYNLPDGLILTILSDVDNFRFCDLAKSNYIFEFMVIREDSSKQKFTYSFDFKLSDNQIAMEIKRHFSEVILNN